MYVASPYSETVTPISVATRTAGKPIRVTGEPLAMAMTPNGAAVYVVSGNPGTRAPGWVTPISTATNTVSRAVTVGQFPSGIAITPDGTTAWVLNWKTVTPVSTATNRAGPPVSVQNTQGSGGIAIAPDGKTAYTASATTVVPVRLATRRPGPPIRLRKPGAVPRVDSVAITPNGRELYVLTGLSPWVTGAVYPVNTATGRAGKPLSPDAGAMALSPDGATLYVAAVIGSTRHLAATVVPISTATNQPGKPVTFSQANSGSEIVSMAVAPSGGMVYVAANIGASGAVFPVSTRTGKAGKPITVAPRGYDVNVIAVSPDGRTAWVASIQGNDPHRGLVTPVNLATDTPGTPIRVGLWPDCLLITAGHPAGHAQQGTCFSP